MLRPFPARAVRDALGLVRLLYLDALEGTDLDRQHALIGIGEALAEVLRRGQREPASFGRRASFERCAEAMHQLEALGWTGGVAELVQAARARVAGPARTPPSDREVKREALAVRR